MGSEKPRQKGSRMTLVQAAEIVLRQSSEPLHSKEILRRAVDLGLIGPKGASPDHSLQAAIWRDLNERRKRKSPFVMLGSGRIRRKYWLKSKKR